MWHIPLAPYATAPERAVKVTDGADEGRQRSFRTRRERETGREKAVVTTENGVSITIFRFFELHVCVGDPFCFDLFLRANLTNYVAPQIFALRVDF